MPSIPFRFGSKILTFFSQELDHLVKLPGEAVRVLEIMKSLLSETPIDSSMAGSLVERVTKLQEMFKEPSLAGRIDKIAISIVGLSSTDLSNLDAEIKKELENITFLRQEIEKAKFARSTISPQLSNKEILKNLKRLENELKNSEKRVEIKSIAAIRILHGEMKVRLEEKIEELKRTLAKREENKKICQPLKEIPPHRIHSFISTIEYHYHKKFPQEEALIFAVAKGMVRAVIKLPSGLELSEDKGLSKGVGSQIEADLGEAYEDAISLVLATEAMRVYGKDGEPYELYQKSTIDRLDPQMKDEKFSENKDPRRRVGTYVRPDYEVREILDDKIFSLVYSDFDIGPESGSISSSKVSELQDEKFMRTLSSAYLRIKKEYEGEMAKLPDLYTKEVTGVDLESLRKASKALIDKVEVFAEMAVEFYILKSEEIPSQSALVRKKLLKDSLKELTIGNAKEVKEEYLRDRKSLLALFLKIDSADPLQKKRAFEMVANLIDKGFSIPQVAEKVNEWVASGWKFGNLETGMLINSEFGRCFHGTETWKLLGVDVKDAPLPDEILDILRGNNVGKTQVLVLIPEFVNGEPLTLELLGNLMKKQLPRSRNGYASINLRVPQDFMKKKSGPAHWVLMTKTLLPNSQHKLYAEQETMVHDLVRDEARKPLYEVSDLLSLVVSCYLHYITLDGKKLLREEDEHSVRVQEEVVKGIHLDVGDFSPSGLSIGLSVVNPCNSGVMAIRKFLPSGA